MKGAIGVVEFDTPVERGPLCERFAAEGAWIRPMGRVVYLTPALVMDDEDLGRLTGALRRGLGLVG